MFDFQVSVGSAATFLRLRVRDFDRLWDLERARDFERLWDFCGLESERDREFRPNAVRNESSDCLGASSMMSSWTGDDDLAVRLPIALSPVLKED